MRVVLDTNVLLSAFGARGLCESLFSVCLQHHRIVLSEYILEEFARGFAVKFRAPAALVEEVVQLLRDECEIVTPAPVDRRACRDAKDLKILGTAAAARADVLVTGDAELIALQRYEGIPIESPRAFYDRLR